MEEISEQLTDVKFGAPEECDVIEKFNAHRYGCTAKVAVSLQNSVSARCSASAMTSPKQDRLFAVGLTNYSIQVRKGEALESANTLEGHTKMITDVRFSKQDQNLLYSSSLDGTVRIWDLRQSKTVQEFKDDSKGSAKPLTCFGLNCDEAFLCAGTETIITDTFLLFWDLRSTKLLGGYWESHTDEVTQVCFHGTEPNKLASSSTDGLINIFDISQSEEDDALEQTLNTEVSVDLLRWYDGGKKLACLTYNETLQFWDVDESTMIKSSDRKAVAKELQMEESPSRFLQMSTNDEMENLCLLASSKRENVYLINVEEDRFVPHGILQGTHSSLLTHAYWDMQNGWALTADESALLYHWKEGAETVNMSLNKTDSSLVKRTTNKRDVRQKPY